MENHWTLWNCECVTGIYTCSTHALASIMQHQGGSQGHLGADDFKNLFHSLFVFTVIVINLKQENLTPLYSNPNVYLLLQYYVTQVREGMIM